jgi:pimeloyl-ACP methyl ester carboxylesterase
VISLGAQRSRVGPTYVGESVKVVVQNGIVEILHGAVRRRSVWAPILIVHGDTDRIPIKGSLEWAASLQNSRLVRLPGVGHFAFLEAPDDLHPVLSAFLSEG